MNSGPSLVCAGCGEPTTLNKPVCDRCVFLGGGTPAPSFCALCETALNMKNSPVLPADEYGIHKTSSGGYAGKCVAIAAEGSS